MAVAFNDAINRRDLAGLGRLMTGDHTFIDPEGNVVAGRQQALSAWEGFFEAFPDYRNEWSQVTSVAGVVIAAGRSVCSTEPLLDGPALWAATTAGDRVTKWQVYEDTPANRRELGIDAEG